MIIIADFRKNSGKLGLNWKKGVPIEVIPMAYFPIMGKLKALKGDPKLRMAQSKSGPLITDNGNFILDVVFGKISDPEKVNLQLKTLIGVVDSGLFIDMIDKAYIGQKDGSVKIIG